MFHVKWILGNLLMPLPMGLLLAILALMLFWRKKTKQASFLLLLSISGLYLFSLAPVAFSLISPLEYQYPVFSNEKVSFIHVLGNGHIEDGTLPITSQLTYTSTLRVVEAVRIWRLNPQAHLLFSGYRGFSVTRSTADMHRELALSLGVPEAKIQIFEQPRDTEEEVLVIKPVVGVKKVAVVTTANHMRRTMGFYERAGLNVISAPTMHMSRNKPVVFNMTQLYPAVQNLQMSTWAMHEWLGIAWHNLKNL
ncbi:ElyC/SanA/YdcF family protein [Shewanella surugensis]|uniref:YdcF family protein n=1 Tax=Shewanella surugensis TaxID=212020 RepID=A0ABT0LEL2_9GAMM|nr:ElyC/SanA/YdcF family protein [Shewanella surugensis]MCL1125925.1 YdcF family protein [Shewanella surugensis]